jgi:preprotein translocase subunit SecG
MSSFIRLTFLWIGSYNLACSNFEEDQVKIYVDIALIITSLALITSVILQNKGVGLGGLTGDNSGGVFSARRGIEKTLFWITIILSVLFFALTFAAVLLEG